MKSLKYMSIVILMIAGIFSFSCQKTETEKTAGNCNYLNFKTPGNYQAGGVRMIKLKEGYKVWTKQFGNAPIKVLLLHGGPAMTHEYMEAFESFFPKANIEFFEYDQLGSYYSDQPDNDSLWVLSRFVEEVEQVRKALGLNKDNFFLLGNSWGGLLAMEYAAKYQQHLKGLIICNMTASFDSYVVYNTKLRNQLRPSLLDSLSYYEKRKEFHNPKYQQLVFDEYYRKHLCRLPVWPEAVMRSFKHINQHIYEFMQGPSEFVPGGNLQDWTIWDRLPKISVPTLTVGGKYDTMDPEDMRKISQTVQNGKFLYCPNGSHLSMWDDQEVFMKGVVDFIKSVK